MAIKGMLGREVEPEDLQLGNYSQDQVFGE